MSDMIPKKTFFFLFLVLIRPFTEFLNLSGNLMHEFPDNGL